MTLQSALIVHPAPDVRLLTALSRACDHILVLSGPDGAPRQIGSDPRVSQHLLSADGDAVALACELGRRHDIAAAPPVWEGGVEATAEICAALGLPASSAAAARASRDKYLAARCFAKHAVPHPRTLLFSALAPDPAAIERHLDFPFIVKCPSATNSQSVALVRSREDLDAYLAMIRQLYDPGRRNRLSGLYAGQAEQMPVLAQEYVDGVELNIDILFKPDAHVLLGVFEKHPMPGPTFEEIQSVYPPRLSRKDLDECIQVAVAAVRALGATIGAAHVELRFTDRGPFVLEAALRPGGFLTPQAIEYLAGIHPATALTRLLISGELPRIDACPGGVACLYGAVNCAVEGRIVSITDERLVRRAAPDIFSFTMLKRPGDRVAPLPLGSDYHVASFMLVGPRREGLEATAQFIRDHLDVVVI